MTMLCRDQASQLVHDIVELLCWAVIGRFHVPTCHGWLAQAQETESYGTAKLKLDSKIFRCSLFKKLLKLFPSPPRPTTRRTSQHVRPAGFNGGLFAGDACVCCRQRSLRAVYMLTFQLCIFIVNILNSAHLHRPGPADTWLTPGCLSSRRC